MLSQLDKLQWFSAVVPETADLEEVRRHAKTDVNLTAARVRAAAQLHEHDDIVDEAVAAAQAQARRGNRALVATYGVDRLMAAFARRIAGLVPGRVSVEIDARLAHDTRQLVERARSTMERVEEGGVDRHRLLAKLPGTWEGIRAAEQLLTDGIRSHVGFVLGLHQAAACADAGVDIVEVPVGRISDWHKAATGAAAAHPEDDPGVLLATQIFDFVHQHDYPCKVMASTFRSPAQAIALAGCDSVTLPGKLIEVLAEPGEVAERLHHPSEGSLKKEREPMDANAFRKAMVDDSMATAKLQETVRSTQFTLSALEKLIGEWISQRQDRAAAASTSTLFSIWDFNGDGFIDREEWGGSDAVFNAIDRDNNGRISLQELAEALGAPFQPGE